MPTTGINVSRVLIIYPPFQVCHKENQGGDTRPTHAHPAILDLFATPSPRTTTLHGLIVHSTISVVHSHVHNTAKLTVLPHFV